MCVCVSMSLRVSVCFICIYRAAEAVVSPVQEAASLLPSPLTSPNTSQALKVSARVREREEVAGREVAAGEKE